MCGWCSPDELPEIRQTFIPRECPKSGCPQPEIGKDGLGVFWWFSIVPLNSCRGCQVVLFDVHMVLPPFLQDICRRGRGDLGPGRNATKQMVFGKRLDIFSPRRWSDASSWPNQRLPREMVGDPSVRASIVWVSWFWGYGIITCHFRRMWFWPPTDNVLLDVVTPKLCAAQIERFYIYNIMIHKSSLIKFDRYPVSPSQCPMDRSCVRNWVDIQGKLEFDRALNTTLNAASLKVCILSAGITIFRLKKRTAGKSIGGFFCKKRTRFILTWTFPKSLLFKVKGW